MPDAEQNILPTIDEATFEKSLIAEDMPPEIEEAMIVAGKVVAATVIEIIDSEEAEGPARSSSAGKEVGRTVTEDEVRDYFNQLGNKKLTREEERDVAQRIEAGLFAGHLLARYKAGELTKEYLARWGTPHELRLMERDSQQAKVYFTEVNLRLVVSIAKRFTGLGMPLLDLVQEGNIGLMKAIEQFDYAKKFKFSTYATWWIWQAVTRALGEHSRLIRLPIHVNANVIKVKQTRRELALDLGREPTIQEIASESDIKPEKVAELLAYDREPLSTDQPVDPNDEMSEGFSSFIQDGDAVDLDLPMAFEARRNDILKVIRKVCKERDAHIVELRFGLVDGVPWTLDQIGKKVGVTRERIRQILGRSLAKIKKEEGGVLKAYRGMENAIQPYGYHDKRKYKKR
jgi:RNA polymerase sigma factor (sigma-70 family)